MQSPLQLLEHRLDGSRMISGAPGIFQAGQTCTVVEHVDGLLAIPSKLSVIASREFRRRANTKVNNLPGAIATWFR